MEEERELKIGITSMLGRFPVALLWIITEELDCVDLAHLVLCGDLRVTARLEKSVKTLRHEVKRERGPFWPKSMVRLFRLITSFSLIVPDRLRAQRLYEEEDLQDLPATLRKLAIEGTIFEANAFRPSRAPNAISWRKHGFSSGKTPHGAFWNYCNIKKYWPQLEELRVEGAGQGGLDLGFEDDENTLYGALDAHPWSTQCDSSSTHQLEHHHTHLTDRDGDRAPVLSDQDSFLLTLPPSLTSLQLCSSDFNFQSRHLLRLPRTITRLEVEVEGLEDVTNSLPRFHRLLHLRLFVDSFQRSKRPDIPFLRALSVQCADLMTLEFERSSREEMESLPHTLHRNHQNRSDSSTTHITNTDESADWEFPRGLTSLSVKVKRITLAGLQSLPQSLKRLCIHRTQEVESSVWNCEGGVGGTAEESMNLSFSARSHFSPSLPHTSSTFPSSPSSSALGLTLLFPSGLTSLEWYPVLVGEEIPKRLTSSWASRLPRSLTKLLLPSSIMYFLSPPESLEFLPPRLRRVEMSNRWSFNLPTTITSTKNNLPASKLNVVSSSSHPSSSHPSSSHPSSSHPSPPSPLHPSSTSSHPSSSHPSPSSPLHPSSTPSSSGSIRLFSLPNASSILRSLDRARCPYIHPEILQHMTNLRSLTVDTIDLKMILALSSLPSLSSLEVYTRSFFTKPMINALPSTLESLLLTGAVIFLPEEEEGENGGHAPNTHSPLGESTLLDGEEYYLWNEATSSFGPPHESEMEASYAKGDPSPCSFSSTGDLPSSTGDLPSSSLPSTSSSSQSSYRLPPSLKELFIGSLRTPLTDDMLEKLLPGRLHTINISNGKRLTPQCLHHLPPSLVMLHIQETDDRHMLEDGDIGALPRTLTVVFLSFKASALSNASTALLPRHLVTLALQSATSWDDGCAEGLPRTLQSLDVKENEKMTFAILPLLPPHLLSLYRNGAQFDPPHDPNREMQLTVFLTDGEE